MGEKSKIEDLRKTDPELADAAEAAAAENADDGGDGERIEDTQAIRTSSRRSAIADLNAALAKKRCGNCGQIGLWRIASTKGRLRQLNCTACGASGQVAV